MTLAEALKDAAAALSTAGIANARLDAEVLLSHIMRKNRVWLITHGDNVLDDNDQRDFDRAVRRRTGREPLQHIIGNQEFWGLEFKVTPDVLIPRPETEFIIEAALTIAEDRNRQVRIIDLCTGSGCIAVSLAKELSASRLIATDASMRALAVARENARDHGVADRIRFLEGDLFAPLEELDIRAGIDIIVSNPPYVKSGDLPTLQPEVRDYEPEMALIAGPGGTEIAATIITIAPEYLKKNGALIMEMGLGQAKTLIRMIEATGAYGKPEILKDLAGIERVLVARKA
ncbi:MAG: peptide chain release factor N(5)-glutamine methyltransferase [Nitrospirota bacterium]